VPTVANVNTNPKKGAGQATGFVGFNHGELILDYNVSDHLYVQANTYLSGFYKNYDGAIGYTGFSRNKKFFTTHAIGYGYGHMNSEELKLFDPEAGFIQGGSDHEVYIRKIYASYYLNRPYLQSTIGFRNEKQSVSLGGRLNLLYYTNYRYNTQSYVSVVSHYPNYTPMGVVTPHAGIDLAHKNSQVLDAFATWNIHTGRIVSLYFQCLFSIPLNAVDRYNNQHHLLDEPGRPLLSTGLNFNLNFKKKTQ
jgi:hypothetical protein